MERPTPCTARFRLPHQSSLPTTHTSLPVSFPSIKKGASGERKTALRSNTLQEELLSGVKFPSIKGLLKKCDANGITPLGFRLLLRRRLKPLPLLGEDSLRTNGSLRVCYSPLAKGARGLYCAITVRRTFSTRPSRGVDRARLFRITDTITPRFDYNPLLPPTPRARDGVCLLHKRTPLTLHQVSDQIPSSTTFQMASQIPLSRGVDRARRFYSSDVDNRLIVFSPLLPPTPRARDGVCLFVSRQAVLSQSKPALAPAIQIASLHP